MEKFKITIRDDIRTFMCDIIIYRDTHNGGTEMLDEQGEIIAMEKWGVYIKPTLRIHRDLLPVLMQALQGNGINLPEKAFTDGKLEATERHLQDMRNLVFKK